MLTRVNPLAAFRQAPEFAWGLLVVLALALWRNVTFIATTWHFGPDFIRDYQGIWYFVDYRSGFVRRGLVGEALRLVGIGTDDPELVFTIGVGFTIAAIVGLIWLAIIVATRGRTSIAGLTAAIVLLTSPLFIALPVHDLARLDAVGIVFAGAMLLIMSIRRVPTTLAVIIATLLMVAATAVEELLLPFLLPVAICALWARLRSKNEGSAGRLVGWGALLIVPAAIVFVLSYLRPVTKASAEIIVLKTGGALWEGGLGSPAWSLTQTTDDGRAFVATFPDHGKTVLLAAIAFVLVAVALVLLTRAHRFAFLVAIYLAAAAFAFGTVAVDVQRWWGLALMAFAASVVSLQRDDDLRQPTWVRGVLGVSVAGSLVLALMPAVPKMAAGFGAWSDLAWRTLFG